MKEQPFRVIIRSLLTNENIDFIFSVTVKITNSTGKKVSPFVLLSSFPQETNTPRDSAAWQRWWSCRAGMDLGLQACQMCHGLHLSPSILSLTLLEHGSHPTVFSALAYIGYTRDSAYLSPGVSQLTPTLQPPQPHFVSQERVSPFPNQAVLRARLTSLTITFSFKEWCQMDWHKEQWVHRGE